MLSFYFIYALSYIWVTTGFASQKTKKQTKNQAVSNNSVSVQNLPAEWKVFWKSLLGGMWAWTQMGPQNARKEFKTL